MNRYQEVLFRAKKAHSVQAIIKFRFGVQIDGTRLTPLFLVESKTRARRQRSPGVATEEEVRKHEGGNKKNSDLLRPLQASLYMFMCECGKKKEIRLRQILRANGKHALRHTQSCGCLRNEKASVNGRKGFFEKKFRNWYTKDRQRSYCHPSSYENEL